MSRLFDILNQATETKLPPGTNDNGNFAAVTGNPSGEPTPNDPKAASWNKFVKTVETKPNGDFNGVVPETKTGNPSEQPTAASPDPIPSEKVAVIPDETFRMSARGTVDSINGVQSMIFTPLLEYRFINKIEKIFPDEQERDMIMDAVERELDLIDEQEKTRVARMRRLINRTDKKKAAIPFTEEEKADATEAFFNYYKTTNTTMSPGVLLAITMGGIMSKRVGDALFD